MNTIAPGPHGHESTYFRATTHSSVWAGPLPDGREWSITELVTGGFSAYIYEHEASTRRLFTRHDLRTWEDAVAALEDATPLPAQEAA
jgi:hypothetical protein